MCNSNKFLKNQLLHKVNSILGSLNDHNDSVESFNETIELYEFIEKKLGDN
jgi:hypothetical protein